MEDNKQENKSALDRLLDMGFEKEHALNALQLSKNKFDEALNLLVAQ